MGLVNGLRIGGQLVLGRRRLFQYYTNVNWKTCENCLRWHGRIAARPSAFPDRRDGCPREILAFPVWELGEYREKARLMAERAQAEIERRKLFWTAAQLLAEDDERALGLFDKAGAVDVYIPELEQLVEEQAGLFTRNVELRARLREVFLRRWKGKFAHPRYERLPERMRIEQERWGVQKIGELFP